MSKVSQFASIISDNLHRVALQDSLIELAAVHVAKSPRTIITIGMGKSSYVAMKLAASLKSITKAAHYLHPAEALHGDFGVVTKGHVCVIISKSGNSSEINNLLPILSSRDSLIIAITNVAASPLAQAAQIVIPLLLEEEGDAFNLLPLASCQVSLFICDYLISRVSELVGFTPEAFAMNHPGGQIGMNLVRKLDDLESWQSRRPFVRENDTVLSAIIKTSESRAGVCCIVNSEEKLLGILTDGDIRRAIVNNIDIQTTVVESIMNASPVTAGLDAPLNEIMSIMECGSRKVGALPVVENSGRCLGVVLIHDLL